MSEQWFLDLDGVRSGPYQTSEVMSLVAEGEVLPHHQIATDLKSQKWMTVLEWRLNQNKSTPTFSPAQEKPSSPIAPVVEIEKPVEKPNPIITPLSEPVSPPKINPSPASSKPAGKRDPMAEMFDMLQNTKQKREVKAQQSHTHSHTQPANLSTANLSPNVAKNKSKGSWGKTIAIGMVITIIGFALGQYFQHQKTNQSSSATATPRPAPTLSPSSTTENQSATSIVRDEVIDRSTDKMTIRAQVPTNTHSAASPSPTAEPSKDIQELKDLKKELLELKALKDEIRGNEPAQEILERPDASKNINHYDVEPEQDPENPPLDENGNPLNPETTEHY
jgi:hypothetical protein